MTIEFNNPNRGPGGENRPLSDPDQIDLSKLTKERTSMHDTARWHELTELVQTSKDVEQVRSRTQDFADRIEDAQKLGPSQYWFHGCYLAISKRSSMETTVNALVKVNELEIQAAPKLVGLIEGPQDYAVLVLEFNDGSAGPPEPISAKKGLISESAKEQFRADIHLLAENGLAHDFANAGYYHWQHESATGRIMLNQWGALRELEDFEREEYLQDVEDLVEAL